MSWVTSEAVNRLSEVFVRGVVSGDMADKGVEDVLIMLMVNAIVGLPDKMVRSNIVIGRKPLPEGALYEIHMLERGQERALPSVVTVKMTAKSTVEEFWYGTERPANYDYVVMMANHMAFLYDIFYVYEQLFNVDLVRGKW